MQSKPIYQLIFFLNLAEILKTAILIVISASTADVEKNN